MSRSPRLTVHRVQPFPNWDRVTSLFINKQSWSHCGFVDRFLQVRDLFMPAWWCQDHGGVGSQDHVKHSFNAFNSLNPVHPEMSCCFSRCQRLKKVLVNRPTALKTTYSYFRLISTGWRTWVCSWAVGGGWGLHPAGNQEKRSESGGNTVIHCLSCWIITLQWRVLARENFNNI